MAKILLMEGGQIRPIESSKFKQEAVLQDYLAQYPELLPLHEVEDNPAPMIAIGREVAVPSGAIDLLFLDTSGRLTVVETKLAKNPQVRREVIGQIIEYASFLCQWDADKIEQQANEYLTPRGKSETGLFEALASKSRDSDLPLDADAFRSKLEENLHMGNIRLVIAVDELVEPLRATVSFLNSFSAFDLLILQLRDFELDRDKRVFIPSLFGYAGPSKTTRPPALQWNTERFLQQASERSPENLPILKRLVEFSEGEKAIVWGRGASIGTFRVGFNGPEGKRIEAFYVAANGTMEIGFASLIRDLDQDAVKAYREALSRTAISPEAIVTDTWKDFDVSALNSEQSWDAFVTAVLALRASVQATHD